MTASPFEIHVAEETLADLRERLARTRWPADSSADLKELVAWWRDGFDWRAQEAALNARPHFTADVDGVRLHFVHIRGRGSSPVPLVLTHGWPSTFYEYLKIAPLLTDDFDVVIPSLPGYGFSDALPWGDFRRVPELWVRLMTDVLGYDRFGAYGGDIGAMVTNRLALEYPERLIGIVTSVPAEPYVGPGAPPLSDAEQALVDCRRHAVESGRDLYTDVTRTHGAELAVAFDDSPAGLAAWLLRFWRDWSDCDGEVERRFTKDELLTTIMLYWATGTIGTSFRPYVDWALGSAGRPAVWRDRPEVSAGVDSKPLGPDERISVPSAIALFSLVRTPREWAERAYTDIRRFTELPRGGHFGAMEEPELLAAELHAFFGPLR